MKSRKYIYAILLIIWMITVFVFSHQPSDESSVTSGKTTRAILSLIPAFNELQEIEQEELVEMVQPFIRKIAHLSIYTLGGILTALYINEYNLTETKKFLFSSLVGLVYSITDEIHQLFIPGRAGLAIDVVIDTIGVILGVAIVWTVIKIVDKVVQQLCKRKGGDLA